MRRFAFQFLLAAAFGLTGCGKKDVPALSPVHPAAHSSLPKIDSATDATAPVTEAPPETQNAATAAPAAGTEQKGLFPPPIHREYVVNGAVDLEALTATMRDWCYWTNRFPSNLEELVTTKYLPSLPEPPPGKKYRINETKNCVELVNK